MRSPALDATAVGNKQPRYRVRDIRTEVKARLGQRVAAHLLFATTASRHVVDLPVGVNVGQDYRDCMNAGQALLRLANLKARLSPLSGSDPLCAASATRRSAGTPRLAPSH